MNKERFIILSSLLVVIILFVVEQYLQVDYIYKTITKLILMIVIPFFFMKRIKQTSIKEGLNLKKLSFGHIKLGLLLGGVSFAVLLISYALFKDVIDFDGIVADLESKNITASTFIFIGLYISLVNSFLEEFFFRGYIFLNLNDKGHKRLAYSFSSLLFALYHIAIFATWFNIYLMGLALLGLVVIGLVFNYLDTLTENFLNSYLVHILANLAIVLIGLRLFGLI